jgi:hypothetical protein
LALLGAHWGESTNWAIGQANVAGLTTRNFSEAVQLYFHPIPEPSSWVMLLVSTLGLLGCRRLIRARPRRQGSFAP